MRADGDPTMRGAQLTLHTTVLLLALGSWLLLFTVELGAVASEGEEVFHPARLGAYITSAGFAGVTCLLLTLWCLGTDGRTSYTSVMPAEDKDAAAPRCSIIFWHYAIHGILVLATICWICIHSVNLQHQQVWRGVLTLYSLLSLTLICFSQRKAVGRGLAAPKVVLRPSKGDDEGARLSRFSKPSPRTSGHSKCATKTERWKPLFQDPNFSGEVPQGAEHLASRNSKRKEWRSFVFEEQAEAILSPTSAMKAGMTLPTTYQKNLIKLRGIARRGPVDSDQGSVRRSSFASSDQGDWSYPVSPTFPRLQRTQSQPSVSSGFSDVSDCIATPTSPSLQRGISKDSRRISKDSRRDSRHSAESESAMSDVSELGHVAIHSTVLASVEEESSRLATVEERSEVSPSRIMTASDSAPAGVVRPSFLQGLDSVGSVDHLRIPGPAATGHPFSLDSARTVNSDCVEGILAELKVEDSGNGQ